MLLLPLLALAQEPVLSPAPPEPPKDPCAGLVRVVEDRMEDTVSFANIEPIVWSTSDNYGIVSTLLRGPVSPMPNIWVMKVFGGSACVDDTDKAIFLFKDGTRFTFENDVAFNCEQEFTLYMGPPFGKSDFAEKLLTSDLEAIRVWTRGENVDLTLKPVEAQTLRNILTCMYNPLPTKAP